MMPSLPCSFFLVAWLPLVAPQIDSCATAELLAIETFELFTSSDCDEVRKDCSAQSRCDECVGSSTTTSWSTCWDGCAYKLRGLGVNRLVTGRNFVDVDNLNQRVDVPSRTLTQSFTSQTAVSGSLRLDFPSSLRPECRFTFNDVACQCTTIYCDEAQQTANFYIDCSQIEGGAILNLCDTTPTVLTPASTDLEFLWHIPDYACGRSSVTFEDPNSVAPESAPSTAPDEPPASTSMGSSSGGQAPTTGGDDSSNQPSGAMKHHGHGAIGAAAASAIMACLI